MEKLTPRQLFLDDDGVTPNSHLPVLIYALSLDVLSDDPAQYLEVLFQQHGWTNNWRDTVMSRDHYHSSTHEVLGISKGRVRLNLGGGHGTQIEATAGTVLVLPAGVGHYDLDEDKQYEVIGGYPDGKSWDMIYNEPAKYAEAKAAIKQLALPSTDPVFGSEGALVNVWANMQG